MPVDAAALAARVRAAVAEVVGKQAAAGIDLVNDGEMSKPSYATYIKDRLAGFGGTGNTFVYQDLAEFPNLAEARVRRSRPLAAQDAGLQRSDIACAIRGAARADVDNLKAALAGVEAPDAFMSAASPGVVSLFFRNEHYPSEEAYLFAIADAMRQEYETVGGGRHRPADRLPRSRHGPAHPVRGPQPRGVPQARAAPRRGAQPRGRQHPARAAAHAPVLGQLRGTASLRRAARRHRSTSCSARGPARSRSRPPIPRHAHEWTLFERVKLPEGKMLIPGVIESKSNFIEHPELIAQRIGRYANLVGRENVDRRQRLRLRHLGRPGRGRSGRGLGQDGGDGGRRAHRLAEFWK